MSLILWLAFLVSAADMIIFGGNRTRKFAPGQALQSRSLPFLSFYRLDVGWYVPDDDGVESEMRTISMNARLVDRYPALHPTKCMVEVRSASRENTSGRHV